LRACSLAHVLGNDPGLVSVNLVLYSRMPDARLTRVIIRNVYGLARNSCQEDEKAIGLELQWAFMAKHERAHREPRKLPPPCSAKGSSEDVAIDWRPIQPHSASQIRVPSVHLTISASLVNKKHLFSAEHTLKTESSMGDSGEGRTKEGKTDS